MTAGDLPLTPKMSIYWLVDIAAMLQFGYVTLKKIKMWLVL